MVKVFCERTSKELLTHSLKKERSSQGIFELSLESLWLCHTSMVPIESELAGAGAGGGSAVKYVRCGQSVAKGGWEGATQHSLR